MNLLIYLGFLLQWTYAAADRRSDYPSAYGKVIRAVTINNDPFMMMPKGTDSKDARGYLADLRQALEKEMGLAEMKLYLVPDKRYGFFDSTTQKWRGMVGELVDRRADIIFADLTKTRRRMEVIGFTESFMHTGITMMYKSPGKGKRLPFYNLEQMVGIDIKYGPLKGGSTYSFFKNTNARPYKGMFQVFSQYEDDLPTSMAEAVKMVRKGDFVFIGEGPMIDYHLGLPDCNLLRYPAYINEANYAFGYRKNDQQIVKIADDLSRAIIKLREDGKLSQMHDVWWSGNCTWAQKVDLCVCDTDKRAGKSVVTSSIENGNSGKESSVGNYVEFQFRYLILLIVYIILTFRH